MIPLTLHEIATAVDGTLEGPSVTEAYPDTVGALVVDGVVSTDSRLVGPGGLFVARVGEHADGHDYLPAAREAGAVAALVERVCDDPLPQIVTADTEIGFGLLGRAVIEAAGHPLTVIAVTGSSGKTSTKDLLGHVLSGHGPTVAAQESYNSEIGVPLTVCRITPDTRYLVVEMGARGLGHLRYLTTIAPPDIAVVLNVGHAHASEFGSLEAVQQAKSELVEALTAGGLAVLTATDPRVAAMAPIAELERASIAWVSPRRPITTPDGSITSEQASGSAEQVVRDDLPLSAQPTGPATPTPSWHVWAEQITLDDHSRASFQLHTDRPATDQDPDNAPATSAHVQLRLHGGHHVSNALSVAAVALQLGMTLPDIAATLSSAEPASRWRMELTRRPDGVTVVNDAYNANPDSMAAALRALAAITPGPGGRRWAVLGAMLELGEYSADLHAGVGRLAADLGIDRLVVVGDAARPIADGVPGTHPAPEVSLVADADAGFALLAEGLREGDVALFKSSRDSGLRWLGDRVATAGERSDG